MGLFDTTHTLNFLTGAPLAATVETQDIQPFPGQRTFVRNSRPLVDGSGTVPSVSLGRRERLVDSVRYGPAMAMNALGTCGVRGSGRYCRAQITIPTGSANWLNCSGVELDAVAQGTR
jgi:hypothetical protein